MNIEAYSRLFSMIRNILNTYTPDVTRAENMDRLMYLKILVSELGLDGYQSRIYPGPDDRCRCNFACRDADGFLNLVDFTTEQEIRAWVAGGSCKACQESEQHNADRQQPHSGLSMTFR